MRIFVAYTFEKSLTEKNTISWFAEVFDHIRYFKLKLAEDMYYGGSYRINLIPSKNIDIWPNNGPK